MTGSINVGIQLKSFTLHITGMTNVFAIRKKKLECFLHMYVTSPRVKIFQMGKM